MALVTASGPWMRVTVPSLRSLLSTALETTDSGPRMKMSGFLCRLSAATVSGGSWLARVYSTGSPDLAA